MAVRELELDSWRNPKRPIDGQGGSVYVRKFDAMADWRAERVLAARIERLGPLQITYRFRPQSVALDVRDDAGCARWAARARAALRATYPAADVDVSYELGARGCQAWVCVDDNLSHERLERALRVLEQAFVQQADRSEWRGEPVAEDVDQVEEAP